MTRRRKLILVLIAATVIGIGIDVLVGAPVPLKERARWARSHWDPEAIKRRKPAADGADREAWYEELQGRSWQTYAWEYRIYFIDWSEDESKLERLRPSDSNSWWVLDDIHVSEEPLVSVNICGRPRSIGARLRVWYLSTMYEGFHFE